MGTVRKIPGLLLLLFIFALPLHAQESRNDVVMTGEGLRIFQTIYFPEAPDVSIYIVDIELITESEIIPVERIETEINNCYRIFKNRKLPLQGFRV
jgi:hypothetical protein